MAYRICFQCRRPSDAQLYECEFCGTSLSGTMPRQGEPPPVEFDDPPETSPTQVEDFHTAFDADELVCHGCGVGDELVYYLFGLAELGSPVKQWAPTAISLAISAFALPFGSIGYLAWRKDKALGRGFVLKLVLCPDCADDYADYYGKLSQEAYSLHPWYDRLVDAGYTELVPELRLA